MTALYLAEIEYHDPADASVNRMFWSEDFTRDTVWRSVAPFPSAAVTSNAAVNPVTGEMTADRLDFTGTGGGGAGRFQAVTVTPNTAYTLTRFGFAPMARPVP